jgi:hypothetical protein
MWIATLVQQRQPANFEVHPENRGGEKQTKIGSSGILAILYFELRIATWLSSFFPEARSRRLV